MTVEAKSSAPIHHRRFGMTRGLRNVSGTSILSDPCRGRGVAKPRSSTTSKLDQLVHRERREDELSDASAASNAEDLAALHGAGRPELARHGNPDLRHRHRV